jgi:hypothetical protein
MTWKYKPSCHRTSTLKTDSSSFSGPFNFHPHTPTAIRFNSLVHATMIQVHGTEEDDIAIRRCQTATPDRTPIIEGSHRFSQFLQADTWIVNRIGHDHFLPNTFQFIIRRYITDLIFPAALWVLGPTQPLTEMTTRNLPGGRGRPVRKADNMII